jgi:endogenous inhibitor of DNA gyrase (YacG/DUF329 family)
MSARRCPSCEKPVADRAQNPAFPFCSKRCQAVDMGKWLGEEFRVADQHAELDEDGDQPPRPPGSEEIH